LLFLSPPLGRLRHSIQQELPMKILSTVLAAGSLLALAACSGGGEAGNNVQANGADAANVAAEGNDATPAGNDSGAEGGKPTDGNAVGGKPTGEAGNEQ
jgi:hypothetical protein